jgi:uncharacterized protein YjbI with pentapeptide repeats
VDSSPAVIVVGMAEDGDTPAPEKEKGSGPQQPWWLRLLATARVQWPHIVAILFFAIFILTALAISIFGYVFQWGWTGVTEKRFWHWLELLIAPVLLSGGGFLLYRIWAWSDHRIAMNQANEAARDAHLDQIAQKYLDSIQELIVDREAPREEQEAQEHYKKLSAIARARTLNVFEALDPIRKGTIIRFLVNAGLIIEPKEKEAEPEKHEKSDTSGVDPSEAGYGRPIPSPFFIRLKDANLRGACLPNATLQGRASFAGTHLEEADFRDANLQQNNFQDAHLSNADMSGAKLGAGWSEGDFFFAANLSGANLSDADLSHADLSHGGDCAPNGANLSDANLSDANLSGSDLRKADLRSAVGVTNEELEQQTTFLEGATMPNGQKYEEWRKSKGRGEEGENSGTS